MAAWVGNEIRDYFISKGVASALATAIQTYVIRVSATNPQDASLVKALEGIIPFVMQVYTATWGLGLNSAGIQAWILANRSDLANMRVLLGDIIATDIPALIDSPTLDPAGSTTWSLKNLYSATAFNIFKQICYYMRSYSINWAYAAGHANDLAYGTRPLQLSTGIQGWSDYIW